MTSHDGLKWSNETSTNGTMKQQIGHLIWLRPWSRPKTFINVCPSTFTLDRLMSYGLKNGVQSGFLSRQIFIWESLNFINSFKILRHIQGDLNHSYVIFESYLNKIFEHILVRLILFFTKKTQSNFW